MPITEKVNKFLEDSEKELAALEQLEDEVYGVVEKVHEVLSSPILDKAEEACKDFDLRPSYEDIIGKENLADLPEDLYDEVDNVQYDLETVIANIDNCLYMLDKAKDSLRSDY